MAVLGDEEGEGRIVSIYLVNIWMVSSMITITQGDKGDTCIVLVMVDSVSDWRREKKGQEQPCQVNDKCEFFFLPL